MKIWSKIILLVFGLSGCWLGYQKWQDAGQKQMPQSKAKITKGNLLVSVVTSGKIASRLDVDIKCKASGAVIELPKDVSDSINKGDLLLALDPVDEERNVKQAQLNLDTSLSRLEKTSVEIEIARQTLALDTKKYTASVASAEARLKDAKSRFERIKELFTRRLASQEHYDASSTELIQAQTELTNQTLLREGLAVSALKIDQQEREYKISASAVELSRIALGDARQRLEDTKVYAPMQGVISQRNVQIGQIIASGISNVGGGTSILILSDLSRLFVVASIDESDIGRVRTGLQARIRIDSFPGEVFEGKVERIAARGKIISNVVTFETLIALADKALNRLKPEMSATAEILLDEKKDVLLAPVDGLFQEGTDWFVRKPDGLIDKQKVEIGVNSLEHYEIKSGVKEGDEIFLVPLSSDKWQNKGGRGTSIRI